MSINFKKFLFWEVSDKDTAEIQDHIAKAEESPASLPFAKMMSGQLRRSIPLGGNAEKAKKVEELIGGKDISLNWKKGLVYKADRDGVYKERGKIAKAISKHAKSKPQLTKELLNWYSQIMGLPQWTREEMVHNEKEYTILISAHPIDVLRMSDVGNITSCHSPSGSYFNCAVADAQQGAMVAYLLKKKDLGDSIKSKKYGNFEKQTDITNDDWTPSANLKDFSTKGELFADKKRNIEGMVDVVARLRIRKFVGKLNDKWISIAVPEKRVYGSGHIEAFKTAVIEWARNSQKHIIDNFDKFEDITLVGGEYSDNEPVQLLAQFFDKTKEEVEKITASDMQGYAVVLQQKEINEIVEKWEKKYKNLKIKAWRHEDSDGDGVWAYKVYYEFHIPKDDIIDDEHFDTLQNARIQLQTIIERLPWRVQNNFVRMANADNINRRRGTDKTSIRWSYSDYSDEPRNLDRFLERMQPVDEIMPQWKILTLKDAVKEEKHSSHLPAWSVISQYFLWRENQSWGIIYKPKDEFKEFGLGTFGHDYFTTGFRLNLYRAGFDPEAVIKHFGEDSEVDIKAFPELYKLTLKALGNPTYLTRLDLGIRQYSSLTIDFSIKPTASVQEGKKFMEEVLYVAQRKKQIEEIVGDWITLNWGTEYQKQAYHQNPKYFWPNHSDEQQWSAYDWDAWWKKIYKRDQTNH